MKYQIELINITKENLALPATLAGHDIDITVNDANQISETLLSHNDPNNVLNHLLTLIDSINKMNKTAVKTITFDKSMSTASLSKETLDNFHRGLKEKGVSYNSGPSTKHLPTATTNAEDIKTIAPDTTQMGPTIRQTLRSLDLSKDEIKELKTPREQIRSKTSSQKRRDLKRKEQDDAKEAIVTLNEENTTLKKARSTLEKKEQTTHSLYTTLQEQHRQLQTKHLLLQSLNSELKSKIEHLEQTIAVNKSLNRPSAFSLFPAKKANMTTSDPLSQHRHEELSMSGEPATFGYGPGESKT